MEQINLSMISDKHLYKAFYIDKINVGKNGRKLKTNRRIIIKLNVNFKRFNSQTF